MDDRFVQTRLVRIGNSQGVRIPKPLLEQAGLQGDVRLRVVSDGIIIESSTRPRAGWGEAAQRLQERGDHGLLDAPTSTAFDEDEWSWE